MGIHCTCNDNPVYNFPQRNTAFVVGIRNTRFCMDKYEYKRSHGRYACIYWIYDSERGNARSDDRLRNTINLELSRSKKERREKRCNEESGSKEQQSYTYKFYNTLLRRSGNSNNVHNARNSGVRRTYSKNGSYVIGIGIYSLTLFIDLI